MASQQGFQYEVNAAAFLKPLGFVPTDFRPAGAGHNQPDLMLVYKGIKAGCELKISAASAGSLVLKYDFNNKINPWKFNDIDKTDEEKLFIADLAQSLDLFGIIKKTWKDIPYKNNPNYLKLSNSQKYEFDKVLFSDIKGEIQAAKIADYYNKKNTYYVNVGTHGFYLFGIKNPLKLKNIPSFADSAKATYRARVQYKGSGNYQFTFEMQFSIPAAKKSKFNIAPIDGKSVLILKTKAELGCFV